jgi:predicted nucleotidyltransferase
MDRLYDSEIALLEQANYDHELAGAELVGRDDRQLSSPATLARLLIIFTPADFMDAMAERIRAFQWPPGA